MIIISATRNGIYHDLNETEYSVSILGIEYFFSSKTYLNKFKDNLHDNRDYYYRHFSRIGLYYNFNCYADLCLYHKIEKRGFRVRLKGREYEWQEVSARVLQSAIQKS